MDAPEKREIPKGYKAVEQYGKTWLLKDYPEPTDRIREAYSLVSNASDLFFGLAEDNIGVPDRLWDQETETYISKRDIIAEKCLALCKRDCELEKNQREAIIKLVGASVNMVAVLAEKLIDLHDEIKIKKEELADLGNQATPQIATPIQTDIAAYEAEKFQVGTRAAQLVVWLLENVHHVELKGGAGDIDQVLHALIGEFIKPALKENEKIHEGEDSKTVNAMFQVEALSNWALSLVKNNPTFAGCEEIIERLEEHSIARLQLRRADVESRNPEEIRINQTRCELRELLEAIAGRLAEEEAELTEKKTALQQTRALKDGLSYSAAELDKKLARNKRDDRIIGHLSRASNVMYDMLKQGEKVVSVNTVMGIGHIETIAATMRDVLQQAMQHAVPPAEDSQGKTSLGGMIETLEKAGRNYLKKLLRKGGADPVAMRKFQAALQLVESAIEPALNKIPEKKTAAEPDTRAELRTALQEGLKIIRDIPISPEALDLWMRKDHKKNAIDNGAVIAGRVENYTQQYGQVAVRGVA